MNDGKSSGRLNSAIVLSRTSQTKIIKAAKFWLTHLSNFIKRDPLQKFYTNNKKKDGKSASGDGSEEAFNEYVSFNNTKSSMISSQDFHSFSIWTLTFCSST